MIDKSSFIDFLNSHFASRRIDVHHFDSGCSMVDIHLDERGMMCVQIEPSLIGISMIKNYPDHIDFSTIPDNTFYTNADAAAFIVRMSTTKKWENPINFDIKQSCGEDILLYENLKEIGQGGPVTGDLSVNGKPISGYRFGGPVLCDEKNIYAPVFIKRFFVLGFKLGIIDRVSLIVRILGTAKGVIFLNRIEEGRIYFFEDVFGIKENSYILP